jgi:hypothetical protein
LKDVSPGNKVIRQDSHKGFASDKEKIPEPPTGGVEIVSSAVEEPNRGLFCSRNPREAGLIPLPYPDRVGREAVKIPLAREGIEAVCWCM